MKRLIIIPTFPGHFGANTRFLESLLRYGSDFAGVAIRFILGDTADRQEFEKLPVCIRAAGALDFAAVELPELLRLAGVAPELIAQSSLERMGNKFSYQSLKKVVGLMAYDYEQALLLDSECTILRPLSLTQLFDSYFASPFVVFSMADEELLRRVTLASLKVIGGEPEGITQRPWFFEYQGWFYRQRSFAQFRDFARRRAGRDLVESIVSTPDIFETVSYNWYLRYFAIGEQDIRFVAAEDVLQFGFGSAEAAKLQRLYFRQPHGIVEHLLLGLSIRRFRGFQRIVKRYRLSMLRIEPYHAKGNTLLVWLFLKLTPEVKMLACSEGAVAATLSDALRYTYAHFKGWLRKKVCAGNG